MSQRRRGESGEGIRRFGKVKAKRRILSADGALVSRKGPVFSSHWVSFRVVEPWRAKERGRVQ
jgi:hypothetical protein